MKFFKDIFKVKRNTELRDEIKILRDEISLLVSEAKRQIGAAAQVVATAASHAEAAGAFALVAQKNSESAAQAATEAEDHKNGSAQYSDVALKATEDAAQSVTDAATHSAIAERLALQAGQFAHLAVEQAKYSEQTIQHCTSVVKQVSEDSRQFALASKAHAERATQAVRAVQQHVSAVEQQTNAALQVVKEHREVQLATEKQMADALVILQQHIDNTGQYAAKSEQCSALAEQSAQIAEQYSNSAEKAVREIAAQHSEGTSTATANTLAAAQQCVSDAKAASEESLKSAMISKSHSELAAKRAQHAWKVLEQIKQLPQAVIAQASEPPKNPRLTLEERREQIKERANDAETRAKAEAMLVEARKPLWLSRWKRGNSVDEASGAAVIDGEEKK